MQCGLIIEDMQVSLKVAFSALTLLVGRLEGHLGCEKAEWCKGSWCGYLEQYGPDGATATHRLLLQ